MMKNAKYPANQSYNNPTEPSTAGFHRTIDIAFYRQEGGIHVYKTGAHAQEEKRSGYA
jgi:hypothetical protein